MLTGDILQQGWGNPWDPAWNAGLMSQSSAQPQVPPTAPVTALITGPTAGIGRCFAFQLAARGHDLVLVARNQGALEKVAAELREQHGVEVEVLAADLAKREDLARVEARLEEAQRPIGLLVNNAGFGLKKPFLDNDLEAEQQMLDVLVTAVMRLSHVAMRAMVARGGGGIINVSSVAGYLPRGTYSAAKAYVTQLSRWADATYRDQGVRTMALLPGFTKTEFHERMEVSRESAPSWLWLDADKLVRDALRDYDNGKSVSVPDVRYKAITAVAQYVPAGLLARFQSVGRK
jgi:short-subunit dehydrogenase